MSDIIKRTFRSQIQPPNSLKVSHEYLLSCIQNVAWIPSVLLMKFIAEIFNNSGSNWKVFCRLQQPLHSSTIAGQIQKRSIMRFMALTNFKRIVGWTWLSVSRLISELEFLTFLVSAVCQMFTLKTSSCSIVCMSADLSQALRFILSARNAPFILIRCCFVF